MNGKAQFFKTAGFAHISACAKLKERLATFRFCISADDDGFLVRAKEIRICIVFLWSICYENSCYKKIIDRVIEIGRLWEKFSSAYINVFPLNLKLYFL
jgi:hypothetical protein